jgi:hypothetical protein
MTALLLSLVCLWPSAPAPRADTYAQITAFEQVTLYEWREHCYTLAIANGRVLRADPDITHVTGRDWDGLKRECRNNRWPVWEVRIDAKPKLRFKLNLR